MRRCSSATSGTIILPASVGVDALASATRSSSGESGSWPIALTTGVRQSDTARSRVSSENGSRSSTLPPPRAMTMTSICLSASSACTAFDDFGHCIRALDGDCLDSELHCGPATLGVLQHVAFGGGSAAADQPDRAWQERQRAFAVGGEEPFCGEQPLEPFDAGEQLTDADRADLERVQLQRAALEVELGLRPDDDPGALGELVGHGVDELLGGRDPQRDVGRGVAQHEEDGVRARTPGDFGQLAVDPDPAEPPDPLPDRVGDRAYRERRFRRGLQGHTAERR